MIEVKPIKVTTGRIGTADIRPLTALEQQLIEDNEEAHRALEDWATSRCLSRLLWAAFVLGAFAAGLVVGMWGGTQ